MECEAWFSSDNNKKSVSFTKKDMYKTTKSAHQNGRISVMATYQAEDKDIYIHISLTDFKKIYNNHILHCQKNKTNDKPC